MTQRPANAPQQRTLRGYIGPKLWVPIGALLAAAIIGLGLVVALDEDKQGLTVVRTNCVVGQDPNCTLRQSIHWHADFAVFIDGEQFLFDDDRYISHEDGELSDAVHIHDPRHTVVHVHLEQTTWDEFLRSIGFTLTDPSLGIPKESTSLVVGDDSGRKLTVADGKTFKFIVNGVPVDGITAVDISDLDRVLISYGPETVEEVLTTQWTAVSDQACIPSELCSDRFPPGGPEAEPCSKSSDTCN